MSACMSERAFRYRLFLALLSTLLLTTPEPLAAADNWPGWRGPTGNGLTSDRKLPSEWAEDKNVLWKIELPGTGWSQPVVWGDKVFVTTCATENQKKPQAGRFDPGSGMFTGGKAPKAMHQWMVLCLDGASGKVLWERKAHEGAPRIPKHRNNTYASETPVTDGQRLVAYFGMTGLYCYDLAGQLLWSKDLGAYPMQFGWGTGSSPVLHDGRVFVQCDNDKASFIVALDMATGDEVWRVERQERSNWSTPYIWKNTQRTELVTAGGAKVRSYDPKTGALLWEMRAGGRNSVTPVGDEELLYVDSVDRLMGRRGHIVAVRPGGSGDITLTSDQTSSEFVAWSVSLSTYRVASPLLYADCLYMLDQQKGYVRCYDAKTGEQHYGKMLPGSRGFTSSPWANDGKVFCPDERGQTTVLQSGPELKVIGANKLDDSFWSSVAVIGDKLLLRGVDHLYCIAR